MSYSPKVAPNTTLLALVGALTLGSACQHSVEISARRVTREELRLVIPDVPDNHTNRRAIEYMIRTGIMPVESDGRFHPGNLVHRGTLLRIFMDAAHVAPAANIEHPPFRDVPLDHPDIAYVARALQLRIVRGYTDGPLACTFAPDRVVSRIETLKVMLLTHGISITNLPGGPSYTDIESGEWCEGLAVYSKTHHLVDPLPDGRMDRNHPMTRADVAEVGFRFLTDPLRPQTNGPVGME